MFDYGIAEGDVEAGIFKRERFCVAQPLGYAFRPLSASRGGIEKDTVDEHSGGVVPF